MTLLIACLLIYHMELSPWLYVIAAALWFGHLAFHIEFNKKVAVDTSTWF